MHLSCKNLSKTYSNGTLAVKRVSLEIVPGKVLGLLGPNGAGKSTTIKMLTGQLDPTEGEIIINNKIYKSFPSEYKSKLGIMPQEIIVWDDLNIIENLEFTADLFRIPNEIKKTRISKLIADLRLEKEIKTLAKNLSGGYKRRLNLAISIVHEPEIIFLDEPTPGIDTQSRILLAEYIKHLSGDGVTGVVLTDHYLEEAEKLSDYIVIIDEGEIVTEGTVAQLKHKHGNGNLLKIDLDPEKYPAKKDIEDIYKAFTKQFMNMTLQGHSLFTIVEDISSNITAAAEFIKKKKISVLNISIKEPSLEDIFLIITGKGVRE